MKIQQTSENATNLTDVARRSRHIQPRVKHLARNLALLCRQIERPASEISFSQSRLKSSPLIDPLSPALSAIAFFRSLSNSNRVGRMPFCDVNENVELSSGIKIFYRRYGRGSTKVLLIIGLAGTHDSWGPQIKGLAGSIDPNDEETMPIDDGEEDSGIEICSFDNRGMGRSSVPTKKSEYTTEKMAKDALALLDHLGWEKAHVVGHSMGAMIAFKLAAVAPNRIRSLALLNVTGGGYECFPKINRQMLSLAYRFLRAKNPEQRAMVDLETHYTKEYLEEKVGSTTRRQILYQQYVRAISSTGMQSPYGFEGQVNACWTHRVTSNDIEAIRSSGFHVSVIHGRDDIIAQMCHAKKLSDKLHPVARMVELPGAHLVSHERTEEVNQSLMDLIKASESNVPSHVWSRSSKIEKGGLNLTQEELYGIQHCQIDHLMEGAFVWKQAPISYQNFNLVSCSSLDYS